MRPKLTVILCAIAALSGCQHVQDLGTTKTNNDSPIIVSDGMSTHLRHKNNATGSGGDFQIVDANNVPEITVNDPTYSPQTIECVNITASPSSLACPKTPFVTLVPGWTLSVYGQAPPSGKPILTLTAPSSGPLVISNFMNNYIDPQPDTSTDADNTHGTDIIEHSVTFASAVFTNGSSSDQITLTCTASPCKVRIHYY
jgi:hypothetical protein